MRIVNHFFIFFFSYSTSKTKLSDPVNQENRMASYRALEQLYKEGKVKQIGVSNYTKDHLQHLLDHCTIIPHVHQFELHPCLHQPDILRLCNQHNIQIQAYSSLGEGKLVDGTVRIDGLREITSTQQPQVSEATVLLRWTLQHGWAIIPKSTSPQRVQQNASVWDIELPSKVKGKTLGNASVILIFTFFVLFLIGYGITG
jgi:diketogulonate reductase-like aldo/keto reductase